MIRRWIPIWTVPFVVLLAIGTVWLRLTIVRTTYSVNQTDRQIRNLQKERERGELRIASLRSPRRLEVLAKARFGLQQPRADQVVYFK